MTVNKNALIRYKILDNCFRNTGKRYFINDLIEECTAVLAEINTKSNSISKRQIFEDIAFMESSEGWSIPLERLRDGKKVYYRYSNLSFSINNMPLNELEINQLQSALDILSQFKGMPQFEWIHELVPKLKQGLTHIEKTDSIIEFDNNHYLKGIENLGVLYNAIHYKKVLKIAYQPFENEESFVLVLHPYYLKQYNNRWFLFGLNQENRKYDWNLALDRIVTITEIKEEYIKNDKIDWNEYFEEIIGVTKPVEANIENIVLNFFGKTGKYIESKPLHGSQKSKWLSANVFEVRLDLKMNYELERLILSYADSVKVLSPSSLAIKIRDRLSNSEKLYIEI